LGLRTIYFSKDVSGCGVEGDPEVAQGGLPSSDGEMPEDPMQVVEDAKEDVGDGEEEEVENDDKGVPGDYPGKFYVERVKIQDRVWVPESGARNIALGDLGNGVVVEED